VKLGSVFKGSIQYEQRLWFERSRLIDNCIIYDDASAGRLGGCLLSLTIFPVMPYQNSVSRGNRVDTTTLHGLLASLKRRFGIQH
jgi:hypothetical protein